MSDNYKLKFTDRLAPHFPKKDSWTVESGTELLSKGFILKPGGLPLSCNIVSDKNIAVELRDGINLYIDVLRPEGHTPVPAIISGGPYGKNGGPFSEFTDQAPFRFGIPQCSVSGAEKFEGLDPAYWCFHGYAIVHSDPRGVGMSEGDTVMTCTQDGLDNYDLIEFLAEQKWCNGKVSMAGNSWLTMTQWFAAAERPPHLTCIAPSEGLSDFYEDTACRGGIPYVGFWDWLLKKCTIGKGKVEDVKTMVQKYPYWNQYWEDRRAKLENIETPMLLVASWCSQLHTGGTFRAWMEAKSKHKWLRIHNSNEWPDLYDSMNVEETRMFFDHFMKDANNGWEHAPKVRMCVLNPGGRDIVNRPELSFPLEREVPTQLYLDTQSNALEEHVAKEDNFAEFDATCGSLTFLHTFTSRTELAGYFTAHLFVEAVDTDDLDLFVKWDKWDTEKNQVVEHLNIDAGYLQPNPEEARKSSIRNVPVFFSGGGHGQLRVSHRTSHLESKNQKLHPGDCVEMNIDMRPYGIIFEKGEKLRFEVSGYNQLLELPWIEKLGTSNKPGSKASCGLVQIIVAA